MRRDPFRTSPLASFLPLDRPLAETHAACGFPVDPTFLAPFVVVVDTREQTPLAFPSYVPTVRATLHSGDYSIVGHEDDFAVERKSLDDLVNTVIHARARFERELTRLESFTTRAVFVTSPRSALAGWRYRSRANPRSVEGLVRSMARRHSIEFRFFNGPLPAADALLSLARRVSCGLTACPPPPCAIGRGDGADATQGSVKHKGRIIDVEG